MNAAASSASSASSIHHPLPAGGAPVGRRQARPRSPRGRWARCWAVGLLAGSAALAAAAVDSPAAAVAVAQALLEPGQPAAVQAKASAVDGFVPRPLTSVAGDPRSGYHLRFDRTHQGVPVMGGDIIVHLRADGTLESVTSSLDEPLALGSVQPAWPRERAQASALSHFREKGREGAVTTTLMVAAWSHITPRPALAWHVEVHGSYCGHPSHMQYWLDAQTGRLLKHWEGLNSAAPWTCTQ